MERKGIKGLSTIGFGDILVVTVIAYTPLCPIICRGAVNAGAGNLGQTL